MFLLFRAGRGNILVLLYDIKISDLKTWIEKMKAWIVSEKDQVSFIHDNKCFL